MVTEIDEGKGLVKTYWSAIRKRVAAVEPQFAKIVDALNIPDPEFPLYLAYFPYGALKGDTISPFMPRMDGTFYRLSDSDAPKDVRKHLGYGEADAPLGLVLEKNFEFFVDLKEVNLTIPKTIYKPGSFTSLLTNLNRKPKAKQYSPNGIFSMTSGLRSVFMLPNIGCSTHHTNLQRDFNIRSSAPKYLCDHWSVFKGLIESKLANSQWRSCLMYFSEKWIERLQTDKGWASLKLYLQDKAWSLCQYDISRYHYDVAFSLTQKKYNFKPNPYSVDTARHLFAIALGVFPGFIPTIEEDGLPVQLLQRIYTESYGLKKYFPTILVPHYFNLEEESLPVYYSLQQPTAHTFSPKARQLPNTLLDLRLLANIMNNFTEEFSKPHNICENTVISKVSRETEFNYYHNEHDLHNIIQPSNKLVQVDPRFNATCSKVVCGADAVFASDARFVRGCISISKKTNRRGDT